MLTIRLEYQKLHHMLTLLLRLVSFCMVVDMAIAVVLILVILYWPNS